MHPFKKFDIEFFNRKYNRKFDSENLKTFEEVAKRNGSKHYYNFENYIDFIKFDLIKSLVEGIEINDSQKKIFRDRFRIAMQSIVAHFQLLMTEGAKKVLVFDTEIELSNNDKNLFFDFPYVGAGWNAALICRNNEALEFLLSVPKELTHRNASRSFPDGEYSYDVIKSILKGEKVTEKDFDKIKGAQDLSIGNAGSKKEKQDVKLSMDLINSPYRELYKCIAFNKKEEFNNFLKDAIDKYIKRYDTLDEDISSSPNGWLPWGLISIACLAYDRGFEITVDHPFIPMFLVKGECNVPTLRG
jgi:hypothetical protein